ncbi:Transient receptor potential cation channel subfamily A member 1 [Paramuricea clavata]|uniref:Transient receptor potential cation channel subfamily A member 1 n=2 Tax=Paramuricea clavata TaxID=317549 RepID=A0A6S7JSH7_PARCT|nr:Transient receptor potential cation channel subfamily A member 1 [Paramuricea clavata]
MEYIRDGCRENGEVCKKCSEKDWVGPRFSRVPALYPDPDKPGHYMSVFNTLTTDNNRQLREVDDVAPRAVIKRLYKAGTISSDNVEQLKDVSSRYCVEEKDVASYVKHLEGLKMMSAIRENERRKKREKECSKTYEDYDWNTLIDSGKLNSLKVMELDKYLKRHDLSTIGKKEDKIKQIKADFYINRTNDAAIDAETSDDDTLSGDGESDSDDDEVLQIIPEGDEDDNSTEGMSEDSDEEIANLPTIRSRRAASFPHARYEDYYVY